MKRLIIALTIIAAVLSSSSVFAENEVRIDNQIIDYDTTGDKPYINADGRLLVPLKRTFSIIGADVDWDEATKTGVVSRNGMIVTVPVGSGYITQNGSKILMDTKPEIFENRIYVPLRPIVEALGGTVTWNPKDKSIEARFSNNYEKDIEMLLNANFNNESSIEENAKKIDGYWKADRNVFYATLKGPAEGQYVKALRVYFGEKMTSNEFRYSTDGQVQKSCRTYNAEFTNYFKHNGESKLFTMGSVSETSDFKLLDNNHFSYKTIKRFGPLQDPKWIDYTGEYMFIDNNTLLYKVTFNDYDEGIQKFISITLFKRTEQNN